MPLPGVTYSSTTSTSDVERSLSASPALESGGFLNHRRLLMVSPMFSSSFIGVYVFVHIKSFDWICGNLCSSRYVRKDTPVLTASGAEGGGGFLKVVGDIELMQVTSVAVDALEGDVTVITVDGSTDCGGFALVEGPWMVHRISWRR